ncbi:MAG: threonylcarbamoyl-AMP synthase [Chloroflexi bacterium]|nr:threonylcarbamoyl-AMP synthase [Chloroflexota bacterium]
MTARIVPDDAAGLARALEVLRSGGIVALPTDTVYGIAVAMATKGGVERLFRVKRRPPGKGVVLLLDDASQVERVAIMTPAAAALTGACWPGGLTVVLAKQPDSGLPEALTGGQSTVGLRVPDHVTARALAAALGPLPTTSANLSGLPEGLNARAVAAQLGEAIELILDGGAAPGGASSTVIDCSRDRPRLIRSGAIPVAGLARMLDAAGLGHDLHEAPSSG